MKSNRHKYKKTFPVILATILAACGGSSDNDNNDSDPTATSNPVPTSTPSPLPTSMPDLSSVSLENAEVLATIVASDILFVNEADEPIIEKFIFGRGDLRENLENVFQESLQFESKTLIEEECDEGKIILDDSQVENFPEVNVGDIFEYTYEDCLVGGEVFRSGKETYRIIELIGDVEPSSTGGFSISTANDDVSGVGYEHTYSDYVLTFSFDLGLASIRNLNGSFIQRRVISDEGTIYHETSDSFSIEYEGNRILEGTEYEYTFISDRNSSVVEVSIQFIHSFVEGRFEVQTTTVFESDFQTGGFNAGEAIVYGEDGSSLQIQAQQNSFDVILSIDEDGDEIYEETIVTNWNDLNINLRLPLE